MPKEDTKILYAILRNDFVSFLHRCMMTLNPGSPFLPNWHIHAMAYQLGRVLSGEITRLIINLPPRYLKSICVSVAFPAFLLGHNPFRKIIGVSYGTDLATKHASDFRAIVHSPWYQRTFPKTKIIRATDQDVVTSARGYRKATSVSAALTGFGGDTFIIDDPQKPVDAQSEHQRNQLNQWVSNTLMSRLDSKQTGAIILVQQRVHLNDLTGFLIENSDDWTILSLPAIAEDHEYVRTAEKRLHLRLPGEALHPEHESIETLERLRRDVGSEVFTAQYQQTPVPAGGHMIRRPWLRYYDQAPERDYKAKIIQSWDTAAKDGAQNDWSVCTTWMVLNKHYYLLDVRRGRYEYPRLRATALALADQFEPDAVLIEDASTGSALAHELREELSAPVTLVPIERDKRGRLYVQQAKFESGRVLFPKGAVFLPELEAELLMFPQGKTDDQVDSLSQALAYEHSGYDETLSWVG